MADLTELNAHSSLADLPLVDCRVDLDVLGKAVGKRFERDSSLPGILVMRGDRLAGLVSRRRFHEQISSPYGLEIFFSRPIRAFLEVSEQKGLADYLLLPATESIESAVTLGLNRSPESVYEPIVVFLGDMNRPQYLLLDFQTLLLAQSRILTLVNGRLEEQSQQNRFYMLKLDEERQRVQKYVALLEQKQQLIRDRNLILERQQVELVQKNQEIAQLNERFVKISQFLSMEGRKTFEATALGVDGICDNTAAIVEVGQHLRSEVKTVQQASDMVARVSYQVRHLATKAAIVASHAGNELSGFTQIAEEISKLVEQTYEAGQQLERVAGRFEERVENLTTAANSGTTIARSLTEDMGQIQDAIAQLEDLIQPVTPVSRSVPPAPPPSATPVKSSVAQAHKSAAPQKRGAKRTAAPPKARASHDPVQPDPAAAQATTSTTPNRAEADVLLELLTQAETLLNRIDQQFENTTSRDRVQQCRQKLDRTRSKLS